MVEDLVWISGEWTPGHADSIISLFDCVTFKCSLSRFSLIAYCIEKRLKIIAAVVFKSDFQSFFRNDKCFISSNLKKGIEFKKVDSVKKQ